MIISFGSLRIKWLLFLLVPIFIFLCNITEHASECDKNYFFYAFLRFLSRSLSFILWIILKKSLSYQKDTENNDVNQTQINDSQSDDKSLSIKAKKTFSEYVLYRERMKKKSKLQMKLYRGKNILLILTGILDFIATTIKYIFNNLKLISNVSEGLTVLSSCSRLLLLISLSHFLFSHEKLHRHQYSSAIIIIIIATALSISSYINESNNGNNNDYFLKLIVMSIPEIFYCLMYISGGFYLSKTQGNVYKLIFSNGIIGLILSIILQIIISFFDCKSFEDYFKMNKNYCNDTKFKTILENFTNIAKFGGFYTFLSIIFNFVEIVSIWLLIYYFSISQFAAVYIIPSFFYVYIYNNENSRNFDDFGFIIVYVIGCLAIIVMALIYNEIIILKCCGLEKNTKEEITKRGLTELSDKFADEGQKDISISERKNIDESFSQDENNN